MPTEEAWPALDHETLPWDLSGAYASPTQKRKHRGPYRAAVPPTIDGRQPRLDAGTRSLVDDATAELARFDERALELLGTDVQLASPITSILLRTESASSSQIEDITVGARQLALFEIGEARSANAALVSANVRAMRTGLELVDDISEQSLLDAHGALLGETQPAHAGRWRDQQVWIGGGTIGPHLADFVPPSALHVPRLVTDLVAYCAGDETPPLVQAAVAHAQFETIHPFTDGNGRVGRILVHAVLARRGLTRHVVVPVSAGLLVDVDAYVDALTQYRAGDPGAIVERVAEAVFFAVGASRDLLSDLAEARRAARHRVTARSDAAAWRLVDHLVGQPVISSTSAANALDVPVMTAQRAIDHLTEVGVLTETTGRSRGRVWQLDDALDALDRFAERLRRAARP
ncbi:Fic family protein [Aeromicrobium sp. CnD17-E]|uniref:Fic family protein n=1 Tax=Aeromicrobium sp. CnD17-E TaxID=2954487 RepID=UPI0020971815|nr:Fic family protein [Aeromicrobium sp. CnD17-E]MCO7239334.1 Fic family protein [Aeromicrobium sp. CnD17-E]